jgi:hypothetical protein
MTPPMIQAWCEVGADEIREASQSPAVQLPASMQENMPVRLEKLHDVADNLYSKWIEHLKS